MTDREQFLCENDVTKPGSCPVFGVSIRLLVPAREETHEAARADDLRSNRADKKEQFGATLRNV